MENKTVSHVQRSGGDNLGIGTYVRNSMSYENGTI